MSIDPVRTVHTTLPATGKWLKLMKQLRSIYSDSVLESSGVETRIRPQNWNDLWSRLPASPTSMAMLLPSTLMKELTDTANSLPEFPLTQILASLLKPVVVTGLGKTPVYFEEALAQVVDGPGRRPFLRVINSTLRDEQVLDSVLSKTLGVEVPHLETRAPNAPGSQDHVINIILINYLPDDEESKHHGTQALDVVNMRPVSNQGPLPPPYPAQIPDGPIGPSQWDNTFQDLFHKLAESQQQAKPSSVSSSAVGYTTSGATPGGTYSLAMTPSGAVGGHQGVSSSSSGANGERPLLETNQHLPVPVQLENKLWTATNGSKSSMGPFGAQYVDSAGKRNPAGLFPPRTPLPSPAVAARPQVQQRNNPVALALEPGKQTAQVLMTVSNSQEPTPNFSRISMAARLAMLPTLAAGAAAVWPLWIRLFSSLGANSRRRSSNRKEQVGEDYEYFTGPSEQMATVKKKPKQSVRIKRSMPQELQDFLYWLQTQKIASTTTLKPVSAKKDEKNLLKWLEVSSPKPKESDPMIQFKPAQPKGILTKENDGTFIQTQLTVMDSDKSDYYPLNHHNSTAYPSFLKNKSKKPHLSLLSVTLSPLRPVTSSSNGLVTFTFVQDVPDMLKKPDAQKKEGYYSSEPVAEKYTATSSPLTYINGVPVTAEMLKNESFMKEKFGNDVLEILGSQTTSWLLDHGHMEETFSLHTTTTMKPPTTPELEREKLHSSGQNPFRLHPFGNQYQSTLHDYLLHKDTVTTQQNGYYSHHFPTPSPTRGGSGATQFLSQTVSMTPSSLNQHQSTKSQHSTNPYYHFLSPTSTVKSNVVSGEDDTSSWQVRPTASTTHYSHYYPSSSTSHTGYTYTATQKPESFFVDRNPEPDVTTTTTTTTEAPVEFETSVITNAESTGVRVQLRPMGVLGSLAVVLGGLGMGVMLFPALSVTSLAAPFGRRQDNNQASNPPAEYVYDYDDEPVNRGSQISRVDAKTTKMLAANAKSSSKKNTKQAATTASYAKKAPSDYNDYYYDYYETSPGEVPNNVKTKSESPHVLRRLVENVKSAMDYLKRKDTKSRPMASTVNSRVSRHGSKKS